MFITYIQKSFNFFRNSVSEVKFIFIILQGIHCFLILSEPTELSQTSKEVHRALSNSLIMMHCYFRNSLTSECPHLFTVSPQSHRLLSENNLTLLLVCDLLPVCDAVEVPHRDSQKFWDKSLRAVAMNLFLCFPLSKLNLYIKPPFCQIPHT